MGDEGDRERLEAVLDGPEAAEAGGLPATEDPRAAGPAAVDPASAPAEPVAGRTATAGRSCTSTDVVWPGFTAIDVESLE